MIQLDTSRCYLDFLLAADGMNVAMVSYYDRSLSNIKAMGAALNYSTLKELTYLDGPENRYSYRYSTGGHKYDTYIQPIVVGKEKFYHAISINQSINKSLLILVDGHEATNYYDYLMQEFDLPLLREWAPQLFEIAMFEGSLRQGKGKGVPTLLKGRNSVTNTLPSGDVGINKQDFDIENVRIYEIGLTPAMLEEQVRTLFHNKRIAISNNIQRKLEFTNMDSYFKEYGHTLVENLEKTIVPLTELSGDVKDFSLRNMRLYPQQIAQANGILALLDHSNYGILNHGMGTGKVRRCA